MLETKRLSAGHLNRVILGAVGILQFDVVAWRLKEEYGVECSYDNIPIIAARWVECADEKILEEAEKLYRFIQTK